MQVSYAIGKEGPISLFIDTFETNKVSIEEIKKYIDNNFSFKVQNMIDELNLKRPIYKSVSCYGHFGRNDLDLFLGKNKKLVLIKYFIEKNIKNIYIIYMFIAPIAKR